MAYNKFKPGFGFQCHSGTPRNGFPVRNSTSLGSHTGPPVSFICVWQPRTMKSLEYDSLSVPYLSVFPGVGHLGSRRQGLGFSAELGTLPSLPTLER